MLVLKKNALICFSLIMTIYLKYKYKFKYKYKYKNELKRLEWIDEGVAEKLFLSAEMDSVISTPNFYGDYSVIDNKVPIVFAYTLKNVTGCVDSSSFYNEKYFFLERFQGINQRKANYASGHLMVNHYHFCLNYKYEDSLMLSGNALFLGGSGSGNYFHWLIEVLPKLVIFLKEENNIDLIDYIVVSKKVREVESFSTSLKILMDHYKIDVPIKYVDTNTSIYFEKVLYITTFNHILFNSRGEYDERYCYFLKENLFELSQIYTSFSGSEVAPKKEFPKSFFIKRGSSISGYNKRNYNEDDIIDIVSNFNVECIYIEDYDFMEQVKLFSNAELVVAPSGAFFTNLIFCKKDTVIISWLTPQVSNFSVYSTLSYLFNLDMKFILASQLQSEDIHGEYYLNPTELDNILGGILVGMKDEMKETN